MGIQITTILKDGYLWSIVALLLFGTTLAYGAEVYIRNAAPSEQLEYGLQLIALSFQSVTWLLTTVVTTLRFKFRGGLVICLVIGLILTPHIAEELANPLGPGMLSLYVIGGSFAIGFSWLVDRWKRTEGALKLAYTEIEQIFKTAPSGICVIGKDFEILQINEAYSQLLNLTRDDILGKKCYDIFYHELCHTDGCVLRRVLGGEESVEYEVVKERVNGDQIHLKLAATPYRKPDGELLGIVESYNDITELKRAQENLHYYLQEITRAQEDERKRISRELHDSPTQTLIALLHQLEDFINEEAKSPSTEKKTLWSFHERIRGVLRELRRFSMDLRPAVLDDLGLLPALEWITEEMQNGYGLEVGIDVAGNKRRLSSEMELILFRIIQEALNNIAKHARASKANVEVQFLENKVAITVNDNGIGFQVPSNLEGLPKTGRLGLVGIQERVQLLGGKLKLKSELNKGTSISVEVPDLS